MKTVSKLVSFRYEFESLFIPILRRALSVIICCVAGLMASGCQSTARQSEVQLNIESLFQDENFTLQPVITADEIFTLPDSFVTSARKDYYAAKRDLGQPFSANQWLADFVGAQDGGFEYRDHFTREAKITAELRQGNCMSLVVLSAALADEFDIPVKFQDIEVEPIWDKRGGFYLVNGHVNLKLMPKVETNTIRFTSEELIVDFLPQRAIRTFKKSVVSRDTLVAMFYNNVAAEALVNRDYNLAYSLVQQGILSDPSYTPAINTLAVIYRHKKMDKEAESAYRAALSSSPKDLTTLFNLALILGEQGRLAEWAEVHKILELARINNPFYYYDMAQQAYFEQQYHEALVWYKRAVEKADYRHEFYFGLSRAYWATGDERRAQKHMAKALALTKDDIDKQRYQTKLNAMKMR